MLYLVIFFIIAAMITAILLVKINIILEYIKNDWDDHIVFSVNTLGGLLKLKYEIPLIDIEKNGVKFVKYKKQTAKEKITDKSTGKFGFSELLNRLEYFKELYNKNIEMICKIKDYMRGRFIIPEFDLDILIGAGEAHYTGLASGVVWSLYGILLSYITNTVKVIKKKVNIRSSFSGLVLNVDLFCIFSFKLVHIIVIGVKVVFHLLKIKINSKMRMIGGGVIG